MNRLKIYNKSSIFGLLILQFFSEVEITLLHHFFNTLLVPRLQDTPIITKSIFGFFREVNRPQLSEFFNSPNAHNFLLNARKQAGTHYLELTHLAY